MAKKNIAEGLSKFLESEIKKIAKGVSERDVLEPIGDGILAEMRNMISKGISPIEGAGRFPEYKGPSRVRSLKASASAGKSSIVPSDSKYSRRKSSQEKNKSSNLNKTAAQLKNRSYPYNMRKKFPDKRPRPVNLFLSGDFLTKGLKKFLGIGSMGSAKLEIGFKDGTRYADMELGHREGANTQPKRPIIPNDSEKLAQKIQRIVEKILGQQLVRKLKAR